MDLNRPEEMRDIFERVKSNSLHISRVPIDTKEKFIALAQEQFCGDYGFLLKFLIDGLVDVSTQELYSRIEELETRISNLEPLVNKEESSNDEDVIKTISGKIIHKK